MRIFQNHHCHKVYTNPKVPDSTATYQDYFKRITELGHGIISTAEHGWQGRYIEGYELAHQCKNYNKESEQCKKCDKYNKKCPDYKKTLAFLFGTEAYWVKDRLKEYPEIDKDTKEYKIDEKTGEIKTHRDRTNAHICIFAKSEFGRQSINDILSEANITGYYYQPRLDLELIFSLPKDDVWITTACIGFWKYENDCDSIVKQLKDRFGRNFYLEVQYHDTKSQLKLNKHIVDLSNRYDIPLIMGCDSHYISDDKAWERDDFLLSSGIRYDDEYGWFLDYPDGDTAYQRFLTQGALTKAQIEEAMDNTNVFLDVKDYDNACFTKDIKMPILPKYQNNTQEERDKICVDLIWEKWNEEKVKVPQEKYELYEREIQKEIDSILVTAHSDYFLIDYELVKESVNRGGMITPTGRGSGCSFYTNKLLDFTKVDRISAEVKMYPERFISPTRILETKSLVDLDLNFGNPEVAVQVQKELMGEECAYPMIAYGKMKAKSAWKMYAKAKNVSFDLANAVSEQIEKYEKALKEADEEEEEDIDIFDYVDEEYHEILKDSEQYLGLISNIKQHACGHLLYNGNIRREIGLIKCKSKTGKKEYLCTIMDGKWAEDYKFLKNDLLKVSVIELIYRVYDRVRVPMPDVSDLIAMTKNDPQTWDIYAHGFTIGINQVEQPGTRHRIAQYKPTNISQLCAFIAAIRPGFKSMYKIFAERQPFNYGIPTFDNLIQTPEMPASFVLYQEMAMTALNFAGIPMTECYEIVKCISKKRVDRIRSFKDQFLKGFADKIIECENKTKEEADKIAEMVWKIISNSSAYSFNASHSYCVSNDSLYGAYLKSHYPLEFYETFLRIMDEKGNKKDRMKAAQREAEKAFRIRFMPFRFRQDNRNIVADSKTNTITNTLRSIKGFGAKMGDLLYELKDNKYETFTDLLVDLEEKEIMCVKIESLIKIKYFNEFGENGKLLELYKEFSKGKCRYDKKHSEKTKIKRIEGLKEIEASLQNTSLTMKDQLQIEREILGYIQMTYDVDKRFVLIMNLDTTYAPKIEFYCLKNAAVETWKIPSRYFKKHPIKAGDIIYLDKWTSKCKKKKLEDGSFEEIEGTQEWWLDEYTIKTEEFNNC